MLGIAHLDDPILYIYSEKDILLILKATDYFVTNDHRPTPFHTILLYKCARALFDELQIQDFQQGKEKFPIFTLSLNTEIEHRNRISHSVMSLFISTMRPFDDDGRKNLCIEINMLKYERGICC